MYGSGNSKRVYIYIGGRKAMNGSGNSKRVYIYIGG